MKNRSIIIVLLAIAPITTIAQTYKPTYASKLLFAGNETNITNTLTLRAPALSSALIFTLPSNYPAMDGYVLTSTSTGGMSWADPSGLSVTLSGDVTGTTNSNTLDPTNAGIGGRIVTGLNNDASANSLNADLLKYDATLTVVSNDLGINLGNSNTWTGVQTLPTSNAQGNALIASVNGGTAEINGDRVNIDATLVVTANELGINLANTNTWTATQTLPTTSSQSDAIVGSINGGGTSSVDELHGGTGQNSYATGDILYSDGVNSLDKLSIGAQGQVLTVGGSGIPAWINSGATITLGIGNQTFATDPTGSVSLLSVTQSLYRLDNTTGGTIDIDGIDATNAADGRLIVLVNVSSTDGITLLNESSAATSAADRFLLGGDIPIGPNGSVTLVYDNTSSRWRLISSN